MRGRKPTPTAIKVVSGNPGKRKLNNKEPAPTGGLSGAPEWLDDMQKQYWDSAIKSAPPGLLKSLDRDILVIWVVSACLHRKAVQAQSKLDQGKVAPFLTKTPNGMPVQSPYIAIINKQAQIMIKAAAEMGFTPSSRSRIHVESEDIDPGDEFFTTH